MVSTGTSSNREVRRSAGWWCWPCLCLLLLSFPGYSAESAPEYQVKAAYLYNFLKFVQWPEDRQLHPAAPIRVCIVGKNPFRDMLEEIQQRRVADRGLVVAQLGFDADLESCELVYISDGQDSEVHRVLQRTRLLPILTVSDVPDFAAQGGVIGFVIVDNRVRLEINLDVARATGLHISAKLLELATIVACGPSC